MAFCYYLLEANAYLTVAYVFYLLVLKRYSFYQQHRFYLLTISVVSFMIPLIGHRTQTITEPATAVIPFARVLSPSIVEAVPSTIFPDTGTWLLIAYGIVCCMGVARILFGVIKLIRTYRSADKIKEGDLVIAVLPEQKTVFSFFNWLFCHPSFLQHKLVLDHESVHIRQKHSLDILWFELLRAVNWLNPVSYLVLKSARLNHEFIADAEVARKNDPYAYALLLISHAHDGASMLSHAAFTSRQLEVRMDRMVKGRSARRSRAWLLLFFPLLLPMIYCSVFLLEKDYALMCFSDAAGKPQPVLSGQPIKVIEENLPLIPVPAVVPAHPTADKIPAKQRRGLAVSSEKVLPSRITAIPASGSSMEKKELQSVYDSRPVQEKESVYDVYAGLENTDKATAHEKDTRSVNPPSAYTFVNKSVYRMEPITTNKDGATKPSLFESTGSKKIVEL
jgi:beta-lactamase regulating signal transducer with metallopeptidase domain